MALSSSIVKEALPAPSRGAAHGAFPGSSQSQPFPDTPNNITGLQAIGDVSQSFGQVSAVMNNYAQATNALNEPYTITPPIFNSDSYALTFLALAGFQRPDPLMNVPGSQNGSPSSNACMQSAQPAPSGR
jgi:hypothetical protein